MIKFLVKGLLRDPSRSLLPLIIVTLSVAIMVLAHAYIQGALGDIVEVNARFGSGHVKIMTKAYAENEVMNPNDLALSGIDDLQKLLKDKFPDYRWQARIRFSGLLDFPGANGESLEQGTIIGIGADLISQDSLETKNLNLRTSLVKGRLVTNPGEALVSDKFFNALHLQLGQKGTLLSSSMDGSAAVANFTIVGTVRFGIASMDRGAMIADFKDLQDALYMDDAASEILGFRQGGYDTASARMTQNTFSELFSHKDKFSPTMSTIAEQSGFGEYIALGEYMGFLMTTAFTFIVTLVLWNSGIRNGIRRYAEFGLRLAIGEGYNHVYLTQIIEALAIGIAGSIVGTVVGLIPAYYLQEVGIDISGMLDSNSASIMMQDVIKAKITWTTTWIGMVPGILSTLAGSLISGIAIYKRSSVQLFKELEI